MTDIVLLSKSRMARTSCDADVTFIKGREGGKGNPNLNYATDSLPSECGAAVKDGGKERAFSSSLA